MTVLEDPGARLLQLAEAARQRPVPWDAVRAERVRVRVLEQQRAPLAWLAVPAAALAGLALWLFSAATAEAEYPAPAAERAAAVAAMGLGDGGIEASGDGAPN